ncbi:AraC family transcriptional regulator [Pelagicoccus mobilis]|uniref:Helix-turn-helix transcriptional regulator n=1 Tax=Pelagicoccus mobilis TaxID=415221 RepID=A0A934RQY8_9BACT|nr:AraC family transcriptional regulator [Pelagicoccus mobilis]MBK1875920.1 helix-turn-helix transcriptional regulator [Pelagicoccus mobilis]
MKFKLEIDKAEYIPIGNSWNGSTYLNHSWRFYHNNSSGTAVTIEGKRIPLSPQRCQILSPGTLFITDQSRNVTQFYVHFSVVPPYDPAQPGLFEIPFDGMLRDLIESAKHNMSKSDLHHFTPRGLSLVSSICCYAFAKLPDTVFEPAKLDRRIQLSMRKMEQSPQLPHTIEKLAQEAGLCRAAFIRLFKSQTGRTPYALLSEFRITEAKELLAFSDTPIDIISQKTGYRDRFHFSRQFKSKTGQSPAAYRKRSQTPR